MNTTHSSTTTATSARETRRHRRLRLLAVALIVFGVTVALCYVEENWRGRLAWKTCKREIEPTGTDLDWNHFIPPPVPEEQNFFGVPKMQEWFVGNGPTELSKHLDTPPYLYNRRRVIVAELSIGLPGPIPSKADTVLDWDDLTNSWVETTRLINLALGPMAMDPVAIPIMRDDPTNIRPAQIFLRCKTIPTEKQLEKFFTRSDSIIPKSLADENVKVEPAGLNHYRISMTSPVTAAECVAWAPKAEPYFALIRQAVQRPYARMAGDYTNPLGCPIPDFVSVRTVAQRLSGLAKAYLLLGQPAKAVEQLTLFHQFCRILEARPTGRPMTLLAAMINVAVTGLYVDTINDGMRLHAWRQSDFATLEKQLSEIELGQYVRGALTNEPAALCREAEMSPVKDMGKSWMPENRHPGDYTIGSRLFALACELIPRGWIYQNMAEYANLEQVMIDSFKSNSLLIDPSAIDAGERFVHRALARPSPFKLLSGVGIPNFQRSFLNYTHNQTQANQAQVVCALERYRLAYGEYPATLESLVPQFIDKIPADIIGGQPPHYHRTADGKFLLYSIGWTEKDHGGQSSSKMEEGDWVWPAD